MKKGSVIIALAALMSVSEATSPNHPTSYSQCGKHEELVDYNCECKLGYIRYNGNCTRCPPDSKYSCRDKICKCDYGKVYDVESNTCKQTCGAYEVQTPKGCECQKGYKSWNGKCIKDCPHYSSWSVQYSKCVCDAKYEWKGGECKLKYEKPHDNYDNHDHQGYDNNHDHQGYDNHDQGYDNHDQGYDNNNHQHYGNGYCRKNERVTPGGGCDCDYGFTRYNGTDCEKCPVNGHWDVNANYGKGACACNFAFKMEYYECVPDCGKNERFTPGGGCDCIYGFTKYNGKDCEKCPVNGYWDVKADYGKGACACNFGFKMEHYECVPNCGKNERFTSGGGCDCDYGFTKYNGKDCVRECPKRSWYDASKGVCQCEWGLVLKNYECVQKTNQY